MGIDRLRNLSAILKCVVFFVTTSPGQFLWNRKINVIPHNNKYYDYDFLYTNILEDRAQWLDKPKVLC